MGIRGVAAIAAIVGVASFGGVSKAFALSFEEFYGLPDVQQENFIQTALHYYYYGYQKNPETNRKANCMLALNERVMQGGKSYLWTLIEYDLKTVQVNNAALKSVEGVIEGVINRECQPQ